MDLELGGMATLNTFFPRDALNCLPLFSYQTLFLFLDLIFHFDFLPARHVSQDTHKKKGTQRYIQIQESMERRVKDIDRKGNE